MTLGGNLRQLTPREVVFVGGETPSIYQHTGGLVLLDTSERPGFGYDEFRGHVEERISLLPHFRWKLHEVLLGLDLPYWVEDAEFDFDNHVHRIALPSPGDRRSLGELVSYLYARHLDRRRPLWEAWFIEGLEDGGFAFFIKLHHSMMDGEGAARLGELLCDLEPDADPPRVDPDIAGATAGEVPSVLHQSAVAAGRLAYLPVRAGLEVAGGVQRFATDRLRGSGGEGGGEPVPMAGFNCDIGADRGFVFGSVPLAEVKAVKDHFGVTVNDVALALVSGALRDFLSERDELPGSSLRTSIAVSLRDKGDEDFSNHVTTAAVTLATAHADPVVRLRSIAGETGAAKAKAHQGSKGFLEMMGILPPVLVNLALSAAPAQIVPRAAGFNLIVSNVRGSPIPLYFAGGRITALYPMSIIMPGGGLNVTCMSYADELDFGLTVDPAWFREPWPLVDGLRETLDSYLEAV